MADDPDNPPTEAVTAGDPPMPLKPDDLCQAKLGMATLAACIIDALKQSDAAFGDHVLSRLDRAYAVYRNNSDADPQHVLEVIHWTRELLAGWNPVPGENKPLFED